MAELIIKFYPDFRRTINELQRYSVSGKIDTGILVSITEMNIQGLNKALKNKHFGDMRKWVVDNVDKDATGLYKELYQNFYEVLKPRQYLLCVFYWQSINTRMPLWQILN